MMVGDPKCPVGFVGIGKMGFPMASRIAAQGYPVHAYGISTGALDVIADQTTARASRSLAEIGRNCEVVILMLPEEALLDSWTDAEAELGNSADHTAIFRMLDKG